MREDAELLRRYHEEKSEEAFAELVGRRVDFVYAVALRQVGGDAALAADVTQTVFTALARKAAGLTGRPVLTGWLHRTAQFTAVDAVRAEHRRRVREEKAHVMNETTTEPTRDADWAKLRRALDEAMSELGENDRDAVVLRFFEGRPFREVGLLLRVSENAARMRVERALEKMRGILGKRGMTSTAAALGIALANQGGVAAPAGLATTVTGAALAGATITGPATLGLFMSVSKTAVGVTTILVVSALSLAIWQGRTARIARDELAAVVRDRDSLRKRLALAQETQPVVGIKAVATTGASQAMSLTAENMAKARAMAWQPAGPVEHVLDHPEKRAAFVRQQVLAAKAHFERFFRLAGISPAAEEGFLQRVQEQAEAKLDFVASVRDQGYGPNRPPQDPQAYLKLMQLDDAAEREFQSRLESLLGKETYQRLNAYRRMIPEANVADALATRLYATESALSVQQVNTLVDILRENRYRAGDVPQPTNTLGGEFISGQAHQGGMLQSNLEHGSLIFTLLEWQAPITDAAISRLESTLTPVQLAAVKALQAEQAAHLLAAPEPPPQPDVQALIKPTGSK